MVFRGGKALPWQRPDVAFPPAELIHDDDGWPAAALGGGGAGAAAGMPDDPPWAVRDPAHIGDIVGALGTIDRRDTGEGASWWQRLRMLLVIMGPGLIVMVGDNDAGGVATYSQAGQNY